MKKKIFIPHSVPFIGLLLFLVIILVLGIDILIYCLINRYVDFIFAAVVIIFSLYEAIRITLATKISLRQDTIFKCGDGLPKFEKVQYKCEVKYNDIQNIAIVASEKDSRNKRIRLAWASSIMPKKYLEFTLNNEQKIRMCIQYYTKKQIIKMLNLISFNMKAGQNENVLDIDMVMQDWYSYGGYNREDLKIKRGEKIRNKKDKK